MLQMLVATCSRHQFQETYQWVNLSWENWDGKIQREKQPLPEARDDVGGALPCVFEPLGYPVVSPELVQV